MDSKADTFAIYEQRAAQQQNVLKLGENIFHT